jgi:hypothetical protein
VKVATDPHELVQDYEVPVGGADMAQGGPGSDRLLRRYVPPVGLPKRGKKNAAAAEQESERKFAT